MTHQVINLLADSLIYISNRCDSKPLFKPCIAPFKIQPRCKKTKQINKHYASEISLASLQAVKAEQGKWKIRGKDSKLKLKLQGIASLFHPNLSSKG